MKIAFFIDDYYPHVHGVATSVSTLKKALEQRGHEVYIVAPKHDGYVDQEERIIRMPSTKNFVFEKRPTANIYPGLARKLDEYDFDIVHSHTQFYLGVLAHSVAKRKSIPHVTSIHTLYTELIDDYPIMVVAGIIALTLAFPVVLRVKPVLPKRSRVEIRGLSKELMKELISKQGWQLMASFANLCDACISPSQHLADSLLRDGGLSVPCHVMPNSIDMRLYRGADAKDSLIVKNKGEKFIICVARLSLEKRQRILIDSMQYIDNPKVKLVLVGGGTAEQELRDQAEALGLTNRVIFTGMVNPQQAAVLMKQADIFALASYRFDNQPMTFLEASASGLPIVYCDDQLKECLEPENSILTEGIEGRDFAKVFNSLLADNKRLSQLSEGAIKVSRKFDSTEAASKLIDLYQQVIAERADASSRGLDRGA